MSKHSNITANSIRIINPNLLVKYRNTQLGICDETLPRSYDAADALNDNISKVELDECIENIDTEASPKPLDIKDNQSQAAAALDLFEDTELFHDSNNTTYCKVTDSNRIYKTLSNDFQLLIRSMFYKKHNKPLNANSLSETIHTLSANALFQGALKNVYVRATKIDNKIIIDQCNKENSCVVIDEYGFRVNSNSPANFIRKKGMGELPAPRSGGNIAMLRKHLGHGLDDKSFKLLLGWVLGAMRGEAPFPILIITAGHGSGKTTLSRKLRRIIDPSNVDLSSISEKVHDLAVSANASYMISIDNISNITQIASDLMCVTATSGNYRVRKLFTDDDESILKLSNPQLINGISCIPQYPDLLERSLIIELPPISETNRGNEAQIMSDFDSDYPQILGFLYEALSNSIIELPNVKLKKKPRMADFCEFVTAAEKFLGWDTYSFADAMESNNKEICELAIDECSFISAIQLLVDSKMNKQWIGTTSDLIRDLEKHLGAEHVYVRASDWPKNPKKAGTLISRYSPLLKRQYTIRKYRANDLNRTRLIEITKIVA